MFVWLLIASTLIQASLTFPGDCADLTSPPLTHTNTHTEQRHQTQAYSIGMLTHATLSLPQVDILAAVCVECGEIYESSSGHFRPEVSEEEKKWREMEYRVKGVEGRAESYVTD